MKNHKSNCQCCYCKAKRGEMKGKNCSNYGRKHTNPTCQCVSCKSKRGEFKNIFLSEEHCRKIGLGNIGKIRTEEQRKNNSESHKGKKLNHKLGCQCFCCKGHRGETKGENSSLFGKKLNHKLDCSCGVCKAKRGERAGIDNPTYGKKHKLSCTCMTCKAKRGEYKGVNSPMYGKCGENSSNWQGGISLLPYPFNFNEELKKLIRNRDNHTCQLCGKTKVQEGHNLCVHHIDYIKENLDPNNLLTLCGRCNTKVNGNRKYWTEFFNGR